MKGLVKVAAMLSIAAVMQLGACKIAARERMIPGMGSERLVFPITLFVEYKAFCHPGETFLGDEEEE